jgi:signal transduction histidine kinase
LLYAYLRRATPDGRRRLRILVPCILLGVIPFVFIYTRGASFKGFDTTAEWVARLSLLVAPLGYLYTIVRHNTFGVDRVLNRALVYILLSLVIFALYLGPFLILYRLLPGDLYLQTGTVAALTLLVGLSFNQARTQTQRLVDRAFYGGWYDYPGVVETVSDELTRSLERVQLIHVLTRQVPELMQLHQGRLWIGELSDVPEQETIPSQMQFPLTFQDRVRGMWVAGPRLDGGDLTLSDRRILKTLAHQAEMALSNVLLVEALRGQLDEIRKVQHQLLRSREEERARLARELHDGPIQTLVGLNLQVGMLLSLEEEAGSPMVETLSGARVEVKELLSDLRQVCAELRPPMLDTLGLNAALRALAEEWSAQHSTPTQLELPPNQTLLSLPDVVAVNLYRVVQEALANVARHAAARHVTLRLTWQEAHLTLSVHDDGRGFVPPDTLHDLAAEDHFGLVGMQERMDLIGGRLVVDSAPGEGTTVHATWKSDARTQSDPA